MIKFGPMTTVRYMETMATLTTGTRHTMVVLRACWNDEAGVTAIEYGLLAALIAVAALGAISLTGVSLEDMYTLWSTAVSVALNGV